MVYVLRRPFGYTSVGRDARTNGSLGMELTTFGERTCFHFQLWLRSRFQFEFRSFLISQSKARLVHISFGPVRVGSAACGPKHISSAFRSCHLECHRPKYGKCAFRQFFCAIGEETVRRKSASFNIRGRQAVPFCIACMLNDETYADILQRSIACRCL